jgi:hypothetical protein
MIGIGAQIRKAFSKFALFAAICSLSIANSLLYGQQVFGSIYGTVTDKSGGAVPNATVTITDRNKTTKFVTATNASGNYTKGQLIPGTYQVQIEAAGFTKVVSNDITVGVDQAARFDAALEIGNVTVKIQALAGPTLKGSYTYQVAKGDGYGDQDSYTFLYDRALGWGNEDYIPHNQITFTEAFDIPFGRGRKYGSNINRFLDYAVGGWGVSGVTTYYSGLPFTPTIGAFPGNYSRPKVGPNDRPDQGTVSPYAGEQGNRNQWFVGGLGTAFLLPAPNTFGTYPVNSMYGPQFINQDLSLAKSFALTERFRFTLRTDAINAFNHTNLGMPDAVVTDQAAGQITSLASQYQMRRLQFSGRIDF